MTTLERWLLTTAFWLLAAFYMMLGIGVVHAHVLPAVIPIGYGDACAVTVTFGMAAWLFRLGADA